jgi:DNA end-binding protein Ku
MAALKKSVGDGKAGGKSASSTRKPAAKKASPSGGSRARKRA